MDLIQGLIVSEGLVVGVKFATLDFQIVATEGYQSSGESTIRVEKAEYCGVENSPLFHGRAAGNVAAALAPS